MKTARIVVSAALACGGWAATPSEEAALLHEADAPAVLRAASS